jgi:hypothetical protein
MKGKNINSCPPVVTPAVHFVFFPKEQRFSLISFVALGKKEEA